MADWIDDPQEREEVEKVTEELKLPIFKANAKGKFRPWLTEVWGKLEDYLVNLKKLANSKEDFIKDKKTGFNLDKTNLTENDGDKLFTAKGALDLFNRLTTAISTAVENMKNVLRIDIAKKIDKTLRSDSVSSTSLETVATSLAVKIAYDKGVEALNKANTKLNTADGWRFYAKTIGNTTTTTDLNDIKEPGEYVSTSAANKWTNLPAGASSSFHLTVESIGSNYRVQILRHHTDNKMFRRVNASWDRWAWSVWERIDGTNAMRMTVIDGYEGYRFGNVGLYPGSNNELNFYVPDNVSRLWFNYRQLTGSGKIKEFIFGEGEQNNKSIKLYPENGFIGIYDVGEVRKGWFGRPNLSSNDICLRNDVYGSELKLTNNQIISNKDIYVNNSKAVTEAEAWKYYTKIIGNITTATDLNTVIEAGDYRSIDARNKWVNAPSDYTNGAFTLEVEKIGGTYVSQVFKSYFDSRVYKRTYIPDSNRGWTSWERIDSMHHETVGKNYGGVLNVVGTKTAGLTYFDNNTKKLFLCKNNNSDTSANVANYIALDNNSLLERLENLKTKQKIIWEGNSSNITFTLPDNLSFSDISMLIIIGDAPATLLSTQITKLSNNNSYPIFYDNGTNEDNYAEFTKLSNNSARLTCRHSAANQFRGWRNIAIIY